MKRRGRKEPMQNILGESSLANFFFQKKRGICPSSY